MKHLTAREELEAGQQEQALLPFLLGYGLGWEESQALAHHLALLFFALQSTTPVTSPEDLLDLYSLDQLALLVEEYQTEEDAYDLSRETKTTPTALSGGACAGSSDS